MSHLIYYRFVLLQWGALRSVSPGLWGFFHGSILCLHLRDASSTGSGHLLIPFAVLCQKKRVTKVIPSKRSSSATTSLECFFPILWTQICLRFKALTDDFAQSFHLFFFSLKNKLIFCKSLVIGDFCDHFITTCHSYLDTFLVTWCQNKLKDLTQCN